MKFEMKIFVLVAVIFSASGLSAREVNETDLNYLTIKKMQVREIVVDPLNQETSALIDEKDFGYDYDIYNFNKSYRPDPTDKVGKVISVARDLVAFGEDVYRLVIKGKPSNATTYAPISVIPRIEGEDVDILDTEDWSIPQKRTFEVIYENFYGMKVVNFRYSVFYSYGGSYQGRGAYLAAVQIVPEYVRTLFGYDFTATMKLGGLQNQGSRANPVAAATILLEYTVNNILIANNETVSFFVTGKGGFKKL